MQHALGKTAENPFAHSAVAVGAHYDQRGLLGGGGEQSVGGA